MERSNSFEMLTEEEERARNLSIRQVLFWCTFALIAFIGFVVIATVSIVTVVNLYAYTNEDMILPTIQTTVDPFSKGREALSKKELGNAEKYLLQVPRNDPNYSKAMRNVALSIYIRGYKKSALLTVPLINSALVTHPINPSNWHLFCVIYGLSIREIFISSTASLPTLNFYNLRMPDYAPFIQS